jgi:hypothetical protein
VETETRVVNDRVQPTEPFDRRGEDAVTPPARQEVVVRGLGNTALGPNLADDGVGDGLIEAAAVRSDSGVVNEDVRSAFRQQQRVCAPEPSTGAGDDDGLSIESDGVRSGCR